MKRFEDVAQQLVTEWLRAVQHKTGDLTEGDLDQAVDDTFPASDPIAVTSYKERVDALKSLDVVVTPASITFKVPVGVLETASQPDEASLSYSEVECASLSGHPLMLHVATATPTPDGAPIDIRPEIETATAAAASA
jgi:hypothetical protein